MKLLIISFMIWVGVTNIQSGFAGCEEPGYLKKTYPQLSPADAEKAKVKSLVLVSPSDFKAAQPGVGKILTRTKAGELSKLTDQAICSLMVEGELDKNGKRKAPKVAKAVVRKGQIWLVDGNHMAHSMDQAGKGPIVVEIIENWSDLSDSDFKQQMIEKRYVYLRDVINKKTIKIDDLPTSVLAQSDEPYRTLAEYAQDCAKKDTAYQSRCGSGAFAKSPIPFTEFIWGDFLSGDERIHAQMTEPDYSLPEVRNCKEPLLKLALEAGCGMMMDESTGSGRGTIIEAPKSRGMRRSRGKKKTGFVTPKPDPNASTQSQESN